MHVNLWSFMKWNKVVVLPIFKNVDSNFRLGSNVHPEFILELNAWIYTKVRFQPIYLKNRLASLCLWGVLYISSFSLYFPYLKFYWEISLAVTRSVGLGKVSLCQIIGDTALRQIIHYFYQWPHLVLSLAGFAG